MIRLWASSALRRLLLVLTPGLLLIGAAGAHPAYATTVNSIINANGKCLSEENAGILIDICDTTTRQDWNIIPDQSGNFLIQNQLTGHCVTADGTSPGASVIAQHCGSLGSNARQIWKEVDQVTEHGFTFNEIENPSVQNLVMHPSGCGAANELPLFMNVQFQCDADNWRLPGS
jgi:Cytolethal distending toxin A/C domain